MRAIDGCSGLDSTDAPCYKRLPVRRLQSVSRGTRAHGRGFVQPVRIASSVVSPPNGVPLFIMAKRKIERYLTSQFEKHVARHSLETEQKYRARNVDTIRRRLIKLRARCTAKGYERNELFDSDGALQKQGRKLRLRRHGANKSVLTLKGPRMGGVHKQRMEVETRVDYEAAKRILELLNFRVCETYSKFREEYKLDSCAVCLDLIPPCGWFVEIEGTRKHILSVARKLRLKNADRERRSYRRIIREQSMMRQAA